MQKVLVIKQVFIEGPGIIGMELLRRGIDMDIVEAYDGTALPQNLDGYRALIVLGGPMGVYEEESYPYITEELRLIRLALKESIPVLGICLGSQLLARAAGARVYTGTEKEIGFYTVSITDEGGDDPLLSGLPRELGVFQWHGDTFDLPDGAVNLARSTAFEHQMIKVGSVAYGIQFHPEVTAEMVVDWVELQREEVEAAGIDAEEILAVVNKRLPDIHKNGAVVIERFLDLFC